MRKFLPSAKKLRGLCFYRCVCVHRGGGGIPACLEGGNPACLAAGLWEGGCAIPACLATGLQGGAWSGGVPGPGGSAPGGGVPALGRLVSQHALRQTPPRRDSYCCGQYASHWNAFLSRKHSSRMHATHLETVRASQGKGLGHQV